MSVSLIRKEIDILSVYTGLIVINVGNIDRGHMFRDNALKFYRDQAYEIPQKPIGQYMNNNGLLAAILKIRVILDGDHMLHLGN